MCPLVIIIMLRLSPTGSVKFTYSTLYLMKRLGTKLLCTDCQYPSVAVHFLPSFPAIRKYQPIRWISISVFLSLFISYIFFFFLLPPSGPMELSSVCGGVSPVPPVLALSRSIKRRRTHAGRLKSPPTLPYGWWTGRCSSHTALSRREEHPSHLLL